jgi:hypothetical protein
MVPVSLESSYLAATNAANARKPQNGFQQLMQSLQAGDLSGAQQAYAALTTQAAGSQTSASSNSTLSVDLIAVGKALQSGDLSGARLAFAKWQQDAQAGGVTHPHSHHRHPTGAANPRPRWQFDGWRRTAVRRPH